MTLQIILSSKKLRALDDENDIQQDLSLDRKDLSHGQNLEIIQTLDASPSFNRLELVIHDPNTNQDYSQIVNIKQWNNQDHAISKIIAHNNIIKTNDNAEKIRNSIRYQVWDSSTAMINYHKTVD